jgi:hypothetical protein
MNESVFEVEQDGGWLVATQAESFEALGPMTRDLVSCHFEPGEPQRTWPIRLHFVNDPVLAVGA